VPALGAAARVPSGLLLLLLLLLLRAAAAAGTTLAAAAGLGGGCPLTGGAGGLLCCGMVSVGARKLAALNFGAVCMISVARLAAALTEDLLPVMHSSRVQPSGMRLPSGKCWCTQMRLAPVFV
jgi:hypothetical protein